MRVRLWTSTLVATAVIAVGLPAAAHAAPPPFGYQKEVLANFTDTGGRPVLLRRGYFTGGAGFGWDKIFHKHGITNMNLVEKIIRNPNGGQIDGTARVYSGFAQRFRCDVSNRCTEVERIPLKAVVDFRDDLNLGSGQKGVITAYCNFGSGGPPRCPSWVSNVSNVAPA